MMNDATPTEGAEPTCEGCDGSGLRDPASPSCDLYFPADWHVLERCDACARFASDEDAARARYGDRFRIVWCADGGEHVVVRNVSGKDVLCPL